MNPNTTFAATGLTAVSVPVWIEWLPSISSIEQGIVALLGIILLSYMVLIKRVELKLRKKELNEKA